MERRASGPSEEPSATRDGAPLRVAYVVRSWPRLSQTFVVGEVLALERRGVELSLFAMTDPHEPLVQPQVAAVRAPVDYLDGARRGPRRCRLRGHVAVAARTPVRYLRTLRFARRSAQLSTGYATATTRECFADAVRIAARLRAEARAGRPVQHLHAHFAHDPALVALLAARLTGLPFTFTAHARDLYQIPAASLAARAREARAMVLCCAASADYVRRSVPPEATPPLHVVHHGVDLRAFAPGPPSGPPPVRMPGAPTLVMTVGRLVAKKGFDDLLAALAMVRDAGVGFRFEIFGDGPMREELVGLRDRLGLALCVQFRGERPQPELIPALRRADIFALTPYVLADGDRDGVPNVLVEAMACGVPVVATGVGGIPELVRDGTNGVLANPRDVPGIAGSLTTLFGNPPLRARLGAAGRRTVETEFDVDVASRRLAALFAGAARS
jgi:glycosyltransferase involved in cell wall biosynthesis